MADPQGLEACGSDKCIYNVAGNTVETEPMWSASEIQRQQDSEYFWGQVSMQIDNCLDYGFDYGGCNFDDPVDPVDVVANHRIRAAIESGTIVGDREEYDLAYCAPSCMKAAGQSAGRFLTGTTNPVDVFVFELGVDSFFDILIGQARLGGTESALPATPDTPSLPNRYVIGALEDLGEGSLRPGEATLDLPDSTGSRLGDWLNNRDVLRSAMQEGRPIRDATVDGSGALAEVESRRFIELERDYLRSNDWTYDQSTQLWMPPG